MTTGSNFIENVVLRTEEEILYQWDVGKDFIPFVLVRCNVYNHEKYIESAIVGFLKQITTFPFKIQIHDDASTDESQRIIQKYFELYPHIIIPILEKENLWSRKDGSLARAIQANKAGKYIALCEGDDYWVDPYKLEKQVSALEENQDCLICYSNGYIENQDEDKIFREEYYHKKIDYYEMTKQDHKLSLDDAFKIPFPPTASFVFHHKYEAGIDEVPTCSNGDLRIRMYFLTLGKAYYLADKTCVYRKNVPDSAMSRWKKEKKSECYNRSVETLKMLNYIDQLSDYKHSEGIFQIKKGHINCAIDCSNSLKSLRNSEYKRVFSDYSIFNKIKTIIKILIPDYFIDKCRIRKRKK